MSHHAIVNARIVRPNGIVFGTILYNEDGKIVSIIEQKARQVIKEDETERIIDAKGAYAVPGGVDGHVHFGGFGETLIADDFYQGSLAALAGGTTTVVDFCEPIFGETASACIEKRKQEAKIAAVDYAFHFVWTKEYKKQMEELPFIEKEGISNFKLFTVYENTDLTVEEIEEILRSLKKEGKNYSFLIHAEEKQLIESKEKEYINHEKEMIYLAKSRPARSEESMVEKLYVLSQQMRSKICIAHTSAKGSVLQIHGSNKEHICLETCPHYLAFTQDKLKGRGGEFYTMTPPLRKEEDREALWNGILEGDIAMFSTDHCPYHKIDKVGKDWNRVPCGVDGVQVRMIYLFSEGVVKRKLSMSDYVKLTSENAAKFYGFYPRKGCLKAGSDADIVLILEEETTDYGIDTCKGNIDYTIYEKSRFRGKITRVVKSGKTVYDGSNMYATQGMGFYIPT
ncbi:MAG: amidohydrolase family protein [Velocimicrobium sp.]